MQKWEYCGISGIQRKLHSYDLRIIHLTLQGSEESELPRERGVSEEDMLSRVIAQLGDEGWELVGSGNIGEATHSLYFKRPKQE